MFSLRRFFIRIAHKLLRFAIEARSAQSPEEAYLEMQSPEPETETDLAPLPRSVAHQNTVWVPRILWALEWARRNGEEPASAADLAKILTEQTGMKIAATNTARAFRDLKKSGRGQGLWSGDKEYRITDEGRQLLVQLLNSSEG